MDPIACDQKRKFDLGLRADNECLVCPTGLSLMHDPVVAGDCETYERKEIEGWIKQFPEGSEILSPLHDDIVLPNRNLLPNLKMSRTITQKLQVLRDKSKN